MTRIAIAGASGRMGKQLIRAVSQSPHSSLSVAFTHANSSTIDHDAGVLANMAALGIPISAGFPAADQFDVLIDFTHASVTEEMLQKARQAKRPIVIGTTGYNDNVTGMIEAAKSELPILIASNFSVGVNVSMKLLKLAAEALGDVADIEIIEAHHRHKVDAPSGTALSMGEVIAEATGKSLLEDGVYAREGQTGEREKGSIGFSNIRGGDIVGEHTVMFALDGERIEITHRAMDRMVFARGAVRAAEWLVNQPPGLYDMNDVLAI